MDKIRVYELAKELNTTSKRLMEKLAEVDIHVKNHMSILEDHELEALYTHIGINRKVKSENASAEEKRIIPSPSKAENRDAKKDIKSAPRIIRTTKIIIDTKNDSKEVKTVSNFGQRHEHKVDAKSEIKADNRNEGRKDSKYSENPSNLRPGFIYDNRLDQKAEHKPEHRTEHKIEQKFEKKVEPRTEARHTSAVDPGAAAQNQSQHGANLLTGQQKPSSIQKDAVKNVNTEAKHKNEAEINNVPENIERSDSIKPIKSKPEEKNIAEKSQQATDMRAENTASEQERKPREEDKQPEGQNTAVKKEADQPAARQERYQDNKPAHSQDQGQGGGYRNDRGGYNQGGQGQGQGGGYRNDRGGYNQGGQGQGQGGGYRNDRGGYNQGGQGQGQGGYRPAASRPLEIPKAPDLEEFHREEKSTKRETFNKEINKDVKREQKKEAPKTAGTGKENRFKPQKVAFGQKRVSEALSEDFILDEFYSQDDGARKKKPTRPKKKDEIIETKHIPHREVLTAITIPETITVKDLAEAMKKTSTDIIKKLMGLGVMATLNHELDFDTASIVASELGITAEKAVVVSEEDILFDDNEEIDESKLTQRPPVVVVMGHVDHGKTSLLDAIREAHVTEGEAGGITQHIGAYMVKINNRNITFLDTPGHEAFTAMRARGAQVTDIAILVVAADDGVMPQTVEAINHAKAANVSIIVAINKMDKPGANPDRVKQELTEHGIVAEEWGGDAIMVPVSAKKREGIDHLLEMVLLAADMLELKADPERQAKGTIIEAKLDKTKGPTATALVQRGTLKTGDSIVTGTTVGRIRAMTDDKGNSIKNAGPSMPVEILGLPEVPEAGEIFYAITDERVAKQLAEKRKLKLREEHIKSSSRVTLDDLFNQIKEGKVKDLNIIVKADVQGSVEAVKQSLEKLSNDEVRVKIIHGGVGAVTESDVTLAYVSNAIIIGFNVRPGPNVAEAAQDKNVEIKLYRVIYNAIEDIQAAMKGMLEPKFKEVILGHAEVRQVFKVTGVGTIAGCYVTDGKILRNAEVRIVRSGIVVHEGKLSSLKRFKDDAKEVATGFECGIGIERFNDIKEQDVIEAYNMEEVER